MAEGDLRQCECCAEAADCVEVNSLWLCALCIDAYNVGLMDKQIKNERRESGKTA